MGRKPEPPKPARKAHNRIGQKIDYALVSGPVYRGMFGMDSDYLDEAQGFVLLASRIEADASLDISRQTRLHHWLEKHGIQPLPMNEFGQETAEQKHNVHFLLFNADDVKELQKLPRSIYIDDRNELQALGVTKKLEPLMQTTLEQFHRLKGTDSHLGV